MINAFEYSEPSTDRRNDEELQHNQYDIAIDNIVKLLSTMGSVPNRTLAHQLYNLIKKS